MKITKQTNEHKVEDYWNLVKYDGAVIIYSAASLNLNFSSWSLIKINFNLTGILTCFVFDSLRRDIRQSNTYDHVSVSHVALTCCNNFTSLKMLRKEYRHTFPWATCGVNDVRSGVKKCGRAHSRRTTKNRECANGICRGVAVPTL